MNHFLTRNLWFNVNTKVCVKYWFIVKITAKVLGLAVPIGSLK